MRLEELISPKSVKYVWVFHGGPKSKKALQILEILALNYNSICSILRQIVRPCTFRGQIIVWNQIVGLETIEKWLAQLGMEIALFKVQPRKGLSSPSSPR